MCLSLTPSLAAAAGVAAAVAACWSLVQVMRLLTTRFRLGEFDGDDNNPYATVSPDVLDSSTHRQLARSAASASVVLLKNEVCPVCGLCLCLCVCVLYACMAVGMAVCVSLSLSLSLARVR